MFLFDILFQGLVYAIPGPNLLAIACKTETTIEKIGFIFTARAAGSLLGKLLSNWFIHRTKGYGAIMLSLITFAIFFDVFPLARNLNGASCIMIAIGLTYGITSEGKNHHDCNVMNDFRYLEIFLFASTSYQYSGYISYCKAYLSQAVYAASPYLFGNIVSLISVQLFFFANHLRLLSPGPPVPTFWSLGAMSPSLLSI